MENPILLYQTLLEGLNRDPEVIILGSGNYLNGIATGKDDVISELQYYAHIEVYLKRGGNDKVLDMCQDFSKPIPNTRLALLDRFECFFERRDMNLKHLEGVTVRCISKMQATTVGRNQRLSDVLDA